MRRSRRGRVKEQHRLRFRAKSLPECPHCRGTVSGQYDTTSSEPYWHCFECGLSWEIGGRPSFCNTAVPIRDL